jgi:YtcA family
MKAVASLLPLFLGGCAGAPSLPIAGAFFPAWLVCAAVGLLGAVLFRVLAIASGLEDAIPLRLVVYTAFAVGMAVWLWLVLFGDR